MVYAVAERQMPRCATTNVETIGRVDEAGIVVGRR